MGMHQGLEVVKPVREFHARQGSRLHVVLSEPALRRRNMFAGLSVTSALQKAIQVDAEHRKAARKVASPEDAAARRRASSSPDGIRIAAKLLVADWIYTTAWTERVEQGAFVEELTAYYLGHARR